VKNFYVWVFEVLLSTSLDIQQFILKLAMKSNALDAMVKPIKIYIPSNSKIVCLFPWPIH